MIVYHGSNLIVDRPKLIVQNRFLDFGCCISRVEMSIKVQSKFGVNFDCTFIDISKSLKIT